MIAPSCAIAVGRHGTVLRWDGARWTREDAGTTEDLYAVCAAADGVVHAVGGDLEVGGHSLICRCSNGLWSAERSPVQSLLLSVDARDGDVRACGFNGALIESTPDVWRELAAPTNAHLFGIHASRGGWLACGLGGTVLDLPGAVTSVGGAHLTSLTTCDDEIVAVGFDGTVARRTVGRWQLLAAITREHLWGSHRPVATRSRSAPAARSSRSGAMTCARSTRPRRAICTRWTLAMAS